MEKVPIQERTFQFSLRIIRLVQSLPRNTVGFAIGQQLIRSGTSIGANIREGQDAASRADFIKSITIATKEARETEYWLQLLRVSDIITERKIELILAETAEIVKILRASLKKLKAGSK